jgi:hypothetical protein
MPRRAHPNDVNWSFHFPSTPPRFLYPGSSARLRHLFRWNRNRFLRTILCIITTPCSICDPDLLLPPLVLSPQEVPSPLLQILIQVLSAPIKMDEHRAYIRVQNYASPCFIPNHDPPDPISPTPTRNVEYDGVFRYNPSQTHSLIGATPPSQPFVFEANTDSTSTLRLRTPSAVTPWTR